MDLREDGSVILGLSETPQRAVQVVSTLHEKYARHLAYVSSLDVIILS